MSADPCEPVFHVTVLSNWARAFDKYARAYRKTAIPESTYPNEFYVLRRPDLAAGIAKGERLLAKLAQPGNALIALEAQLPTALLQPNARTGIGLSWPSPSLPLAGVHAVQADGSLGPELSIEEVTARALRLHAREFASHESLRPRSVSFLPIARGCQAACPFCFSEASVSSDQPRAMMDPVRVSRWVRLAKQRGAERAVITGGGEPTLLPFDDLLVLVRECRRAFDKVVLITNGVTLATAPPEVAAERLQALDREGLSVLAISRHHVDEGRNARLMNLSTRTPALLESYVQLRSRLSQLRLRLVCVMQRGGVDSIEEVDRFVGWAATQGVHEVCFKELYVSTSHESVYHSRRANDWSREHQVPLQHVLDWADRRGFVESTRLPWGAPVFTGTIGGHSMRVAAYCEPSLYWERKNGIARSWNVMADGTCLVSLEDRHSQISLDQVEGGTGAG